MNIQNIALLAIFNSKLIKKYLLLKEINILRKLYKKDNSKFRYKYGNILYKYKGNFIKD